MIPLLRFRRAAHQMRAGTGRKNEAAGKKTYAPLKLYGQEQEPSTWAMANMNMIIHDMEGEIQIGDTFRNPKFRQGNRLQTFDRAVANPMWNQTGSPKRTTTPTNSTAFPKARASPATRPTGAGCSTSSPASTQGRAAVVLDTGAASRGSGNANTNKEKDVRRWFVEQDLIEGVIYLPENLFYNTTAPGIILFLNRAKPKKRKEKLFLLNASREFAKGDPKNYIPDDAIRRIADTFSAWKEVEKYSRIVSREEIAEERLQHLPQPLHPHGRSGRVPAHCWRSWRNCRRWRKRRGRPMPP